MSLKYILTQIIPTSATFTTVLINAQLQTLKGWVLYVLQIQKQYSTWSKYLLLFKSSYPRTQTFSRSQIGLAWSEEHADPIRSCYWGFWVRSWLGNLYNDFCLDWRSQRMQHVHLEVLLRFASSRRVHSWATKPLGSRVKSSSRALQIHTQSIS